MNKYKKETIEKSDEISEEKFRDLKFADPPVEKHCSMETVCIQKRDRIIRSTKRINPIG